MTPRRALAALALALASLFVLPTVGSAAIVQKWQTGSGVNYSLISQAGDLNGDGTYKLITGELVAGGVRIGIRSGATGALLAQTAATYQPEEFWIANVDADDDAEIIFKDLPTGKLNCLQYTAGSSTLAVRWSYLPTPSGVPSEWEFVDFYANGQLFLAFKDETAGSKKYYIRDNNGGLVTTLDLTTAPSGTGWSSALFVDNYDSSDDALELMIKYHYASPMGPAFNQDVLYVIEENAPPAVGPVSESRVFSSPVKVDRRGSLAAQDGSRVAPHEVEPADGGGR